jgi:hypothetical protein
MKIRRTTLATSIALCLLPSISGQPTQQTVFSTKPSSKQPTDGLGLHGNFLHITDMHVSFLAPRRIKR